MHDFALISKIMSIEQFPAAAQEQGVLARDEAEQVVAGSESCGCRGAVCVCLDDVCGSGEEDL